MNIRQLVRIGAVCATLVVAACGGGGGGIGGTGAPEGTLRLGLTDAPACGYDAVNITVERVRVHQGAGAADGDSGWSEIVLSPPRRVDLLSLSNGVIEELGQTALPAGRYTQLRLVLAPNGSVAPFANSVFPSGGAETALSTPSAQQSGLKLNVNIDVAANQVADFVLDFDACRSIVKAGNSGRYNLKPVISVIPRISDAGLRVVGHVDPSMGNGATGVSLQLDGSVVKATAPDASGRFVLYPVPVGTYALVVTSADRATAVMTGVPVVTTAHTFVSTQSLPIAPPARVAALRTVSGSVIPTTAEVRALQQVGATPQVEVAWAAVDSDSGAFTMQLPIEAPVSVAYVVNPVALPFVADNASAARYTIEAKAGTATKRVGIDASAPVPAISFTFP